MLKTDVKKLIGTILIGQKCLTSQQPDYVFQVAAPMKTMLDRLAFILHRPRFFSGKVLRLLSPRPFSEVMPL